MDLPNSGVDADFGRGNELWKLAEDAAAAARIRGSVAIATPPFYGIELHPSPAGSAGLDTNTDGQVMHLRRFPIPGLYSSGNSTVHTGDGLGLSARHDHRRGSDVQLSRRSPHGRVRTVERPSFQGPE